MEAMMMMMMMMTLWKMDGTTRHESVSSAGAGRSSRRRRIAMMVFFERGGTIFFFVLVVLLAMLLPLLATITAASSSTAAHVAFIAGGPITRRTALANTFAVSRESCDRWLLSSSSSSVSETTASAVTEVEKEKGTVGASSSSSSAAAAAAAATSTTTKKKKKTLVESRFLGSIYRIVDDDSGNSFLAQSAVPTFAVEDKQEFDNEKRRLDEATAAGEEECGTDGSAARSSMRYRGLDGALGGHAGNGRHCDHGPAFVVDNVLSKRECEDMIGTFEREELGGFGQFAAGKNRHGAMQIVVSERVATAVSNRLCDFVDVSRVHQTAIDIGDASVDPDDVLVYAGINRRWRVYRYDNVSGVDRFAPHIDAAFPPSGLSDDGTQLVWNATTAADGSSVVSRLTLLMYLNDDFVGGETKFYKPLSAASAAANDDDRQLEVIASVRPVAGSCLVFPQGVGVDGVDYARRHWPLHEGSPVLAGAGSQRPKYVIRSDVLFATVRDFRPSADQLFRNDHLVRRTFLPASRSTSNPPRPFNPSFLSQLESLYMPQFGVENMGPFLYSFLRLTKKRRVVEVGAGYSSLWILSALADNDNEMGQIRRLHREGKCRLLDWPWVVDNAVENYDEEPAQLLCIDNLQHQKEAATGASAVAKSMGLSRYMKFVESDAFELDLDDNSVDVLWCDFGVGTRMRDFVAGMWSCLRPGGFLLCHSTLTNQRTRDWLEDVRQRKGQETTGLPPDEYVEVSLLEPHKHYQNSISIFQKRPVGYREPIYSEYA